MSSPVALLTIADKSLRERIGSALIGLRWQVLEMSGGAETLSHLEASASRMPFPDHAIILDKSLPDLDIAEFFLDVQADYPKVEMVSVDGSIKSRHTAASSRRGELMHAIRSSLEQDAPDSGGASKHKAFTSATYDRDRPLSDTDRALQCPNRSSQDHPASRCFLPASFLSASETGLEILIPEQSDPTLIPEFIGSHPLILEASRRVRLVAPRQTPVLIQGPSGTGKELIAKAIHRLSSRKTKALITLNCAAIPEGLLEAELFGHTRGAFTGATQNRIGRIEAANGGTLFLDEIGEMPQALQSKLLRFLEGGEIQRIGENEPYVADVRIIAATHQHLAKRSREGTFREDLFHRLSVFTIRTPSLSQHPEDITILAQNFLKKFCSGGSPKVLDANASERLTTHSWPGNVRELSHVVERAVILSEQRHSITAAEIEFDSISG